MNTHQSIFKDGQIVLKLSPVSPNLIMSLLPYSIKFSSQKKQKNTPFTERRF